MDSSAELFFRNMNPSKELTQLVKEQVEKLEHLYQHIIGCRVTIGLANHTHRTGNIPDVLIDIQVPGDTIVVNHNSTEADASAAIHKAFAAAAQQLKSYKQRKMGHVKSHEGGVPGEELAEKEV
jgi:ribosomal subunit interface protein